MADDWFIVGNANTTAMLAPIEAYAEHRYRLQSAHESFMMIWNYIITRRETLMMRSLVAGFSGFVADMQRELAALPQSNAFLTQDARNQYVNRRFGREEWRLRAALAAFGETLVKARGVLLRFWIGTNAYQKDEEVINPDAVRPVIYRNRHQMDMGSQGFYWRMFCNAMVQCGLAADDAGTADTTVAARGGAAARMDAGVAVPDILREMRACLDTYDSKCQNSHKARRLQEL